FVLRSAYRQTSVRKVDHDKYSAASIFGITLWMTRIGTMPELFHVLTVAEALDRLLAHVAPLGRTEQVPLLEALNRVTAEELRAPGDLPNFQRSTMDGFAVRATDTYGASEGLPAYLTVCGEVPMGRAAGLQVHPGDAARVHT